MNTRSTNTGRDPIDGTLFVLGDFAANIVIATVAVAVTTLLIGGGLGMVTGMVAGMLIGMVIDMFVGLGLLSRFNLVFDYSRQRLFVEPNRRFHEPFE